MKPVVVVSGVNLVEAGPLAVMQDALQELATHFPEYDIHALVFRKELFSTEGVTYHAFPEVKPSWLRRLIFEYVQCNKLSKQWKPYLWLAMHDISPRVDATVRAVYCHNPAPFYSMGIREALLSYKVTLFSLFYRYLYKIGICRNDYVIVQQDWMRRAFQAMYGVRRVVVAHPSVKHLPDTLRQHQIRKDGEPFRFFYPAYSRSFKNVEVLLEAMRLLEADTPTVKPVLRLTMDGTENRYAQLLRERYSTLQDVEWLGALPREDVLRQDTQADALLFPSRLETWGMPLTEFKETGKPILVADLPYAHETVGSYHAVRFLPPSNASEWALAMRGLCEGRPVVAAATAPTVAQPYVESWRDLFQMLLTKQPTS